MQKAQQKAAATGSQGQSAAEVEGALHLSAAEQLSLKWRGAEGK